MEIIETHIFAADRETVFTASEFREFQAHLVANPAAGAIIQGTGGARRIRWGVAGSGKSGGARVIYFWKPAADAIYLLLCYRKARQESLTAEQKALLKQVIKRI